MGFGLKIIYMDLFVFLFFGVLSKCFVIENRVFKLNGKGFERVIRLLWS